MKKITLFLCNILLIIQLFGQEIQFKPLQLNERIEYAGFIDNKFPIKMVLARGLNNTIDFHGYYYYTKINKVIKLLGSINIHDSIILYEFSEKYDKNGKFAGVIKNNIFQGVWTDIHKNTLPFRLDRTKEKIFSNYFQLVYNNIKQIIIIKDPDVDVVIPYTNYDILKISKTNSSTYILIFAEAWSNGNCNLHGPCGCGLEQGLIWLALDQNLKLIDQQNILYNSCHNNINPDYIPFTSLERKDSPEDLSINENLKFDFNKNQTLTLFYDINSPEKGIIVSKSN